MIAGGKLTTYRVMAADAVDAAGHSLKTAGTTITDSITDRVTLVGADGFEARSNQRVQLARRAGLHVAGSTTCWGGTARGSTTSSPSSTPAPTWPTRSREPTTTWPPRSSTP